jgi:hypothetical protein
MNYELNERVIAELQKSIDTIDKRLARMERNESIEVGCAYCEPATIPLFRICDNYPNGNDECGFRNEDWCNRDCDNCENAPQLEENNLNLTIAITSQGLMFEDKVKAKNEPGSDGKIYKQINYCPMCGRELDKFKNGGDNNE